MLFSDISSLRKSRRIGALEEKLSLRSSTFVLVRIFLINSLLKSEVFELPACLDESSAPVTVSAFSLFLELEKAN